jgi:hypothetical protein
MSFVKYDLGTRDVYYAISHESVIYIVEAHGPEVVSAHAAEFELVARIFCRLNVPEAFGRFPDSL